MVKKRRKGKITKKREEFTYRGYTVDQLKKMNLNKFATLLPARERRSILRGFTEAEQKLLKRVKEGDQTIKTHLREMVILPEMVGINLGIHNGRTFEYVEVKPEMIGHRIGEFALTRKRVTHGSAGIGATRSSKYIPLK
ncbi:MAG: Ribosomal protein S15, eukaryotic/archaeal [Candidatus Syntrophoarchaeum caldarius]|uniref:Small ribosomal subunit protein uS19 n=1 Tax=Candidatus Syntropharchaeum caldarium TaxID=1838285 RepID=A0A1F2P9Y2_9EURY|nr:MAG: Ribosomal protein S15, eukaryotic/archaeal [Candidatus Syntrophoarchaeum caldarius]